MVKVSQNAVPPESTDQEIRGLLAQIESARSSFPRGGNWDIPIHLTILKDENGMTPIPYPVEQIVEAISLLNPHFTNGMQFFLCSVNEITNPDPVVWLGENLEDIAEEYNHPDAINLYLVSTDNLTFASAVASKISNSIPGIFTTTSNYVTIAHELGHFFGLEHTFRDNVRILPDNSFNSEIFSLLHCSCCACGDSGIPCPVCEQECDCDCATSGDFICDTNVDPGEDYCSLDCGESECEATLLDPGSQPHTFTYNPNKDNIMSYYGCGNNFTLGQFARMNDFLFTFGGYLIDANEPSCSTFDFDYTAKYGLVELVRHENTSYSFVPLSNARVRIFDYSTSTNENITASPDGKYKLFDADIYIQEDREVKAGQHVAGNASAFDIISGVSTQDLILIRKHILSIEQLPKPYAWIAADVNNSGSITTVDVIKLSRLILGIGELDVPLFRYFPVYALDTQWDFEEDFDLNPFTSVWNLRNSETRPYLASGGNKSYLDDIDLHLENPDVADSETWSFRAIKSRDVNFDFDPDLGLLEPDYEFVAEQHDCLSMSEKATVLVKMDGTATVGGFQFGINFNPAYFEIQGIDQGEVAPFNRDFFALDDLQNGELSTLWLDLAGGNIQLNGEKTLFKLYIKAANQLCNIGDHLELVNNSFATEVYSSTGEIIPMDIKIEVIPEEKKHLLEKVFPNPGNDVISFDFEITEAANVSITVQDQYNNTLTYSNSYGIGNHSYSFTNISSLNSGALHYSINMGGEISTGTGIKL